jgi:serine/threonine protein kinase
MKFILKHNKSEKDMENLRQEIDILRGLKHENIIQMLDSFETQDEFCVVTEFGQGEPAILHGVDLGLTMSGWLLNHPLFLQASCLRC